MPPCCKCWIGALRTTHRSWGYERVARNPSYNCCKNRPSLLFSTLHNNSDDNDKTVPSEEASKSKTRHIIFWTTDEGTAEFEAFDGELLRTAALRRGIVTPHNGQSKLINCRGLGTCGTCAVEISEEGKVEPATRNTKENLRLSFPPHNPERQSPLLRLACQVQVRGDLNVTKRSGFWGQYSDLSPSSEHQTYFGEIEYLLDGKSPGKSY